MSSTDEATTAATNAERPLRALEFLERCRDRYPFERLVSHTFPLAEIDEAFR